MKYLHTDAKLSKDGLYRFTLYRLWDHTLPTLVTVGLNPSTADSKKDDATIRKEVGFGTRLGFGSLLKLNLSAIRATDPHAMLSMLEDPVMQELNELHIAREVMMPKRTVVAAWGAHIEKAAWLRSRAYSMVRNVTKYTDLYVLQLTKNGIPSHTLMLPYTCQLKVWKSKYNPETAVFLR